MVTIYYVAVPKSEQPKFKAADAALFKQWISYALSPAGQAQAASFGYTKLPEKMLDDAKAQLALVQPPVVAAASTTAPATTIAPTTTATSGDSGSVFVPGGGSSSGGFSGSSSGGFSGDSSFDSSFDDSSVPLLEPLETAGPDNVTVDGDPNIIERITDFVSDTLGIPGLSPGLVALGLVGAAACIIGPAVTWTNRRRRAV